MLDVPSLSRLLSILSLPVPKSKALLNLSTWIASKGCCGLDVRLAYHLSNHSCDVLSLLLLLILLFPLLLLPLLLLLLCEFLGFVSSLLLCLLPRLHSSIEFWLEGVVCVQWTEPLLNQFVELFKIRSCVQSSLSTLLNHIVVRLLVLLCCLLRSLLLLCPLNLLLLLHSGSLFSSDGSILRYLRLVLSLCGECDCVLVLVLNHLKFVQGHLGL